MSNGFAVPISREIELSDIANGVMIVRDRCKERLLQSNWIVGNNKIEFNENCVKVNYSQFSLNITSSMTLPKKVIHGWQDGEFMFSSIESIDYGCFVNNTRVVIGGVSSLVETRLVIEPVGGEKC